MINLSGFVVHFKEQDTPDRLNLVESVPHSLIQVKSDPESLSGLCIGNSSSLPETPVSCAEAAEDARAKGQLLQEITHVAETFEPYSSSLPPGCYRNYTLSSDAPAHTDYICMLIIANLEYKFCKFHELELHNVVNVVVLQLRMHLIGVGAAAQQMTRPSVGTMVAACLQALGHPMRL